MPLPLEKKRAYQRLWMKRRRDSWIEENGPCAYCGSWDDLEVDHKDQTTKLYRISSLWSMSLTNPKRIAELAKCQVLCESCHVEKTAIDCNYGNYKHGTTLCYHEAYCRCEKCREAMKLYFRDYRDRKNNLPSSNR